MVLYSIPAIPYFWGNFINTLLQQGEKKNK